MPDGALKLNRYQIIAIAVAVICLAIAAYVLFVPPGDSNREETLVDISEGQGLAEIASSLKQYGIIRSRLLFVFYTLAVGEEGNLQAGRYKLSSGLNIPQVVSILARGLAESTDIVVVIPEGFNVWEIDKRLMELGFVKEPGEFAELYHEGEGKFFPDTYRFDKDATLANIAQEMEDNFKSKAKEYSREELILASLLEKEARAQEDMRLISGIIKKRISIGMLLQVDATVAYGWCLDRFLAGLAGQCDVTQAPIAIEITKDNEFNSYVRSGFPPSPISNPGLIALEAARDPAPSKYLFYLSPRDGDRIIYAKTPSEHAANRRKHLGL